MGNAFSDYPQWIQWYEYTGVFGGSLWVWIVNISIFTAIVQFQSNKDRKQLLKKFVLATCIVVLGIFFSLYKYTTYQEKGENVTAIVLQPNTDPYTEKYHQPTSKIATDLVALTQDQIDDNVHFVLAPETVFSNNTMINNGFIL